MKTQYTCRHCGNQVSYEVFFDEVINEDHTINRHTAPNPSCSRCFEQ